MTYRQPSARSDGCFHGCLIGWMVAVCTVLGGLLLLHFAFEGVGDGGRGTEGPLETAGPALSVTRTLSSSTNLDAAHPTAVQAFTISTGVTSTSDLSAELAVESSANAVRLTVLSDDGGPLSGTWPSEKGDTDYSHWVFGGQIRPGRYLAVVELMETSGPATVTLIGHLQAVIRETSNRAPVAPGIDLRMDEVGSFAPRAVTVLQTSYRTTLSMPDKTAYLNLRLRLSGAAQPAANGGLGHVVFTLRPANIYISDSWRAIAAYGAVSDRLTYSWSLRDSTSALYSDFPVPGEDPTVVCPPIDGGCSADIAILTHWVADALSPKLQSGAPDITSHVDFIVEVRDYLLDTTGPPDGATVTLDFVNRTYTEPSPSPAQP